MSTDGDADADVDATADSPAPDVDVDASTGGSETVPAPEDVDAEGLLLSAGVVVPCEDRTDLCLDDTFRANWYERMETIRDQETERDDLARELDEDPEDIAFEDHDTGFVARSSARTIGQWESRAAFLADLAGARELADWVKHWDDTSVSVRSQLIGGLRIFIDSCPICEGRIVTDRETVGSCGCGYCSQDLLASHCENCGARMLEIPHPEATY